MILRIPAERFYIMTIDETLSLYANKIVALGKNKRGQTVRKQVTYCKRFIIDEGQYHAAPHMLYIGFDDDSWLEVPRAKMLLLEVNE